MFNLTYESSFPTPYAGSHFLPLLLLSMMNQKHTPDTKTSIKDTYDYIVVGAGTAGSIVASRLADEACVTVLLLEAGKSPPKVGDIPVLFLSNTDIDWKYRSVPLKHTAADVINRTISWSKGKVIGGSGAINGMIYVRGSSKVYDQWAAQGSVGWDYESVLPYFIKLETNTNPEYVKNGYHGNNGPIFVSNPPYASDLTESFYAAAKELGYYFGDINGPKQSGFYDFQAFMKDGQRYNSAKAYLVPRDQQENFDIVSEAFVKRVIVENHKAVGVEFDFQGKMRRVKASREVILSAGAFNSPKLLMLSGIGPKEELKRHNIKVIKDLPVGKNFQDHPSVSFPFLLNNNVSSLFEKSLQEDYINRYIQSKTGPLASPGTIGLAFLKSDGQEAFDNYPEIELQFFDTQPMQLGKMLNLKHEIYDSFIKPYENNRMYVCVATVLHPKSRGQVSLQSNNPYDPPVIDPKTYSYPDDLEAAVQALKLCKKIGLSASLRKIGSRVIPQPYPTCEQFIEDEDEYYRCYVRCVFSAGLHEVGTSKMGHHLDPTTVVDPKLRVKGIGNLRVVDASVMPLVPGGNTCLPTMMVAERASDFIKEDIGCYSSYEYLYKSDY